MNAPLKVSEFRDAIAVQPAEPIIRFETVSKVFSGKQANDVRALDTVTFNVARGDVFGIIGRSGAGKSTLIRLVNGLEKPTSGRIVVDGTDISGLAERELVGIRRKIGMIFQHFNLLAMRTVFDNVALPLEIAGRSRAEIEQRVGPLLELVGLADKRDRYPAELSGGQKQRVGIARALATQPKVLLCDEATSALDPETTASILTLLGDVNKTLGVSIILITHEIPVIQEVCSHVAVLESGRIVEQGPVLDAFLQPQHPTTESFTSSVTGLELPPNIGPLKTAPTPGGRAILRAVVSGENTATPFLSGLAGTGNRDINIVAGRVGTLAGTPFGAFLVAIPAEQATLGPALSALASTTQNAKVIGYVD